MILDYGIADTSAGDTKTLTPSILSTRTFVPVGMEAPEELRADHSIPFSFTCPAAEMLSISDVTMPTEPMTESMLVGVSFGVSYFRTRGRSAVSAMAETARNTAA